MTGQEDRSPLIRVIPWWQECCWNVYLPGIRIPNVQYCKQVERAQKSPKEFLWPKISVCLELSWWNSVASSIPAVQWNTLIKILEGFGKHQASSHILCSHQSYRHFTSAIPLPAWWFACGVIQTWLLEAGSTHVDHILTGYQQTWLLPGSA